MEYQSERLGELLVRAGLLSPQELSVALQEQFKTGGKLGEVLVRELLLTEDEIAEALAGQKGLTHVNLASYDIDRRAARLLPLGMARRHGVIPVKLDGDTLTLAMSDPLDIEAIDESAIRTGLKILPVVAPSSQVQRAIDKHIAEVEALRELEVVESTSEDADRTTDTEDDSGVAVVRMVNQLIREAITEQASDIHLEPGKEGIRVRFRIDGVLREVTRLPKSSQNELLSRVKIMADMDITDRRRPQDGRISVKADSRVFDVRVATLPTPQGEAITLRILDSEVAFRPLGSIGLSLRDHDRVVHMLKAPHGIIFVSGPTGSGKSTTLYALLNSVNDPGREIITIEDPIEYSMDGITQMAVNPRAGLTFATGLRTILRSDPDVVMIGEVRDPETAEMAVRAALTGHLVLTSVHTNDAPSALTRLTDIGVPPYITSSGLLGVVAQRLVRILCPACKRREEMPVEFLVAAGFAQEEAASVTPHVAVGCQQCANTGYKGRVGVFEVMWMTREIESLFLQNASADELRRAAVEAGMVPLRRDALDKVALGITSIEEIDRAVV